MGGISIPQLPGTILAGVGEIVVYAYGRAEATIAQAQEAKTQKLATRAASTRYRPPQWAAGIPALYMLTVPSAYASIVTYNGNQGQPTPAVNAGTAPGGSPIFQNANNTAPNATPVYLVFDGVPRASHSQPMTPTEHPVQNSANLTDHIKTNQARVTLDVIMTDVLPAYAAGQWVGNASKSISCFQTLDNLRLARVPLTVTTRLKTYYNMFIMDVIPDETVKTLHGFRGTVEFRQLFLAGVSVMTNSARTQTTDSTSFGQIQPSPVPPGVTSQNGLTANEQRMLTLSQGDIIGAGDWSSNNTGALTSGGGS